ncbi:hypothetical protein M4Z12_10180, partial [Pseudomonas sp. In614]|uniref:hypothetical protein n=1 Tax=Pseudomonas nunensis TaxID=2961896 RepID=UPI0020C0414E
VPYAGAKPFAYFSASGKVSRCKSETIISHHRSNGYTPNPQKPQNPEPQNQPFTEETDIHTKPRNPNHPT